MRNSRSAPRGSPRIWRITASRAGDTVAILLPNSTQWIETCLAIARAGAIGVPVSYDASEPEIAYRLEDANCRAIVTTAERGDLVAKLKAGAPNLRTVIATEPRRPARRCALLRDPAVAPRRNPRRAIRR